MTLIELFDSCQIENVVAALRFKPEKIVFVGFKEVMTKKRMSDLQRFFEKRGLDISLEYEIVGRYDFDYIVKTLNTVLDKNDDCCFDLTGGKELVLVAMGVISEQRNVPMIQFNVRSGNIINVKKFDSTKEFEKSAMLIDECIALNGGSIAKDEKACQDWDLNESFKEDIESVWDICRKNPGLWNRQSNVFESFEKFGRIENELEVYADMQHLKNLKQDTILNPGIINALIEKGLILDYCLKDDILTFKYKNNQIRRCISKAGSILELYTYMAAREIVNEDSSFYADIGIGTIVDWDGVVHGDVTNAVDTRNEIDIILMRYLVPLFISCKNGEVHKEALYELQTVAEKFGGDYVKKILIATYISRDKESRKYIMQRARDMNIDIIENADKLDKKAFVAMLRKRAK